MYGNRRYQIPPTSVTVNMCPIYVTYGLPLCKNTTSSTKPEIHNTIIVNWDRATVACTENLVKFELPVFEICLQKDVQTCRDARRNISHAYRSNKQAERIVKTVASNVVNAVFSGSQYVYVLN